MRFLTFLALCLLAPLFAAPVGFHVNGGRFPDAAPQTTWSATERVKWATELPQWSNGCPIKVGDRLFVTAEPATLLCLDLTGKILWQQSATFDNLMTADEKVKLTEERTAAAPTEAKMRELRQQIDAKRQAVDKADKDLKASPDDAALKDALATAKADVNALYTQFNEQKKILDGFTTLNTWRMPGTHPTNGYTSDTPVCDGKRIYVYYGNGVVACYSLDGARQWARMVEKPTHGWGQSGSPVLVGDTLVVQIGNTFGLDAATGATRWSTRLNHNWGTPAIAHPGNADLLVTDYGDVINPTDGKVLAQMKMSLDYNSPLVVDNVAYMVSNNIARAFKLAVENGAMTVTKLWETPISQERYYATPLFDNGLLYLVNQRAGGTLTVLEAASGAKVYEQGLNLGGVTYPSPVLAGNVVIIGAESGKTVVVASGREYKELGRPVMPPYRATPLPDGKYLYLRTCNDKGSKLFCIGE